MKTRSDKHGATLDQQQMMGLSCSQKLKTVYSLCQINLTK